MIQKSRGYKALALFEGRFYARSAIISLEVGVTVSLS